jgi:hypothetical protein
MHSLNALYVVRKEQLPRLESGVPVYDPVVDDVVALKYVPRDFIERIASAKALSVLECDWWAWNIADVKTLLESCPNLEVRFKHMLFPETFFFPSNHAYPIFRL